MMMCFCDRREKVRSAWYFCVRVCLVACLVWREEREKRENAIDGLFFIVFVSSSSRSSCALFILLTCVFG